MYITASSTISHQPTFQNKGMSSILAILDSSAGIVHPDYANFIPVNARRRMTDVLKMAIACASDCLKQTGIEQPDAIIVGTNSGCCQFTRKFLDNILSSNGGLLSPTSFTLSTHNTIAGQISLLLGNHNYNITHSQNSLSFEHALLDAMLCIKEGCSNVLVGAADEVEDTLYNLNARLNTTNVRMVAGASFFVLSSEEPDLADINLVDVGIFGLVGNLSKTIADFMHSNNLSADDIDVLLYSNGCQNTLHDLSTMFNPNKLFDFQKISGVYLTTSAFGMHFGLDILSHRKHPVFGDNVKRILICNNLIPENLGLILLDTKRR